MGRSRLPWSVVRRALVAVSRGATHAEAAALAGVSKRTVTSRVAEEAVVMFRDRKSRDGVLTLEDREEIRVGIEHDESDAQIGRRIGCHRSTVWREIRANGGRDAYRAFRAQERADQAARRPKVRWFDARPWLWQLVLVKLVVETWSPEQIALWLRKTHPDVNRPGFVGGSVVWFQNTPLGDAAAA